jgi:hypothetical protein
MINNNKQEGSDDSRARARGDREGVEAQDERGGRGRERE